MFAKRPYSAPRSRLQIWLPLKSKAATWPVANMATTILPSVTGEGEAMLLRPLSRLPCATAFFHRNAPLFASKQSNKRFFCSSGLDTKTEPFQTIGVAPLYPGKSTDHFTFSVLLHCTGRFVSALEPLKWGPRHCGQFSATPFTGSSDDQN